MSAMLERLRRLAGPAADAASDAQILAAYLAGRTEAFEQLVRRHGPMVWGVCRRILCHEQQAEDAFQATFLVLARKAGSLRRNEALAGWLYAVACRTARKARLAETRRRRREQLVATMMREAVAPDADADNLKPVLDEEVERLPQQYRLPIVFCCLEGETNEEVARRLGCSTGAVKMRLSRARDLLRNRLAQRGVVVSAIAFGTLLESASAAVPEALMVSTLKAAEGFPAGSAAALTPAAALARGVLKDMFFAKIKLVAAAVLALAALGVGLTFAVQGRERGNATPAVPVVEAGEARAVPIPDAENAPAGDKKPEQKNERAKTDPAGVPLELKIVAKEDTYTLKADDVQPAVNLVLEFKNTGTKDISFLVGGDAPDLPYFFKLEGPGAVNKDTGMIGVRRRQTLPTKVDLAAGKSYEFPIRSLRTPNANRPGSTSYWTKPGDYTLTATYYTEVSPAPDAAPKQKLEGLPAWSKPGTGFGAVVLTSAPVKLKVVEAGQDGAPKREEKPDAQADKGSTNPAGLPLELKLIAKRDTYTLDLGGKSAKDFAELLKVAPFATQPKPPTVELEAELRNTGNAAIEFALPAHDRAWSSFQLKGPGAINDVTIHFNPPSFRLYPIRKMANLAAGGTHKFVINTLGDLRSDPMTASLASYWTEPGEYTLTVTLHTDVQPVPKGAKEFGRMGEVTVTSNPIKLKVEEPKKEPAGNAALQPAGWPLELKLVAKKETYTLGLGGQPAKEFVELLKAPLGSVVRPEPPTVELIAELRNNGKESLKFASPGNDRGWFSLYLKGPGAVNGIVYRGTPPRRGIYPSRNMVQIGPGSTQKFTITSLGEFRTDPSVQLHASYWTEPGEYTVTVALHTDVEPAPRGARDHFAQVTVTSNPVKVKVVAPK
jgi:RNA polymerase sigma-70 factor (ECF subfamily)